MLDSINLQNEIVQASLIVVGIIIATLLLISTYSKILRARRNRTDSRPVQPAYR